MVETVGPSTDLLYRSWEPTWSDILHTWRENAVEPYRIQPRTIPVEKPSVWCVWREPSMHDYDSTDELISIHATKAGADAVVLAGRRGQTEDRYYAEEWDLDK